MISDKYSICQFLKIEAAFPDSTRRRYCTIIIIHKNSH